MGHGNHVGIPSINSAAGCAMESTPPAEIGASFPTNDDCEISTESARITATGEAPRPTLLDTVVDSITNRPRFTSTIPAARLPSKVDPDRRTIPQPAHDTSTSPTRWFELSVTVESTICGGIQK